MSFCCHGHTPQKNHENGSALGQRATLVAAFINLLLAVGKTATGLVTNSSALVADGIHSVADLASDIIAYFAIKIGRQAPDEQHPYGHGKFETIGTLVLSILLGMTAIGICFDAAQGLVFSPSKVITYPALIAAVFSIIANEGLFFYNLRVGKKINSPLIIANAWHHRADSLSSAIALAGIGLSMLGYPAFDTIAAFILVFMLLRIAYSTGKNAFHELVEGAAPEETIDEIRTLTLGVEGVKSAHFLRTRCMGGQMMVDIHVEVESEISVSEGHYIAENVEHTLIKNVDEVTDVIVHIDPYPDEHLNTPTCPPRKELEETVKKALQAHAKGAKLAKLTLHILPDGLKAHILLENTKPQNILT